MTTSALHPEESRQAHPMWLPESVADPLRGRTATILGEGIVIDTLRAEVARAGMIEAASGADLLIAPADTLDFALVRHAFMPPPPPPRRTLP